MSDTNSAEYYRGREQRERALARAAVDPGIGAIHAQMADRYSALVAQAGVGSMPRSKPRTLA